MTLQIRDARAHELARKLAALRHQTMTEAVIQALDEALRREADKEPLVERIGRIAADLMALAGPNRRPNSRLSGDD